MKTAIEQREYSYSEVVDFLQDLAHRYRFVKLCSIGKTLVGRPIYAVEIGIDPDKVLYSAAYHGSERLTALSMLIFLEQFCAALFENREFAGVPARKSLFGRTLVVVPCVNPDGYEIARAGAATAGALRDRVLNIAEGTDLRYWNANARGVDINHNFDAGWNKLHRLEEKEGICGPAPRRYGGPCPESEPESYAMAQFARENRILHTLCFHSQGEEIFWNYGNCTPPQSERMARLFAASSGYALSWPDGTASYGGYKDWFIKAFRRPGFTIEMGLGENPLPPSDLYAIYERIEELLLLAMVL